MDNVLPLKRKRRRTAKEFGICEKADGCDKENCACNVNGFCDNEFETDTKEAEVELTILSEGSDLSYVLNDLPSLNDDLFKGTVRKSLHLAFKEFLISAYDPNRKVFKKPRKSLTSMKGRIEACVVKKEKKANCVWLETSLIYVIDGTVLQKNVTFPKRDRTLRCYVCGEGDSKGALAKCSDAHCHTHFHEGCARLVQHSYTFDFMKRNNGIYCPRHHCNACFSDHNRVRCFNGKLIGCAQCELAWHVDCIPAGCEPSEFRAKPEIVCPRHVAHPNPMGIHTSHCADCQQKSFANEQMVKCRSCLRSLHIDCHKEMLPSSPELTAVGQYLITTCSWCRAYDYVRHGQYCMGRLGALKWYPCQVVKNEEYPNQSDPLLGAIGHLVVRWLPYRGRVFHNIITHNRVLPMTEKDFFFITEASTSAIHDEWKLAQQHVVENNPENSLPKPDQISPHYSNGERVKMITRCKYSTPDLKPIKVQKHHADLCSCPVTSTNRCGPATQCINRSLNVECPPLCSTKFGCCGNRKISNGFNCIPVDIVPSSQRYYGAIALVDVVKDDLVGEYIGEIISHAEKERRIERIARLRSIEAQYYIMDLDGQRAIDAHYYGNNMRYVNHSCQPNCTIQLITSDTDVHVVLVALRDIKKGEELSFDYNMYSNSGRAVPKCRCNAPNCSGVLSAAGSSSSSSSSAISSVSAALLHDSSTALAIAKRSAAKKDVVVASIKSKLRKTASAVNHRQASSTTQSASISLSPQTSSAVSSSLKKKLPLSQLLVRKRSSTTTPTHKSAKIFSKLRRKCMQDA